MAPKGDRWAEDLQKAIASANGSHGTVIQSNEAVIITNALSTSASNNGITETRQVIQKVRNAALDVEDAFQPILLKLQGDDNLMIGDLVTCIQAIGEEEAALLATQPTTLNVMAAATATGAQGRLAEALKPGMLTLDLSPIELRQWKKKLFTYLHRSFVPAWRDMTDLHRMFVTCIESAV